MIKKITQSFTKDAQDYFAGTLCGNIMKEKWVNERLIELDSKAAALGAYFEYYFTLLVTGKGTLPKDGKVPERGMYANGKQPLAPYALAEANAVRLKEYFELMGLKVLRAGVKLTKGRFEGTIDLMVECMKAIEFDAGKKWKVGDIFIFDLKYSGLLDDKWSNFGWIGLLSPGPHIQKDYHKVQAIHYSYIGGDYPFYYLVVSSTNENDIGLFHVGVTEEISQQYRDEAAGLFEKFEFEAKIGFEARPSISVCNGCPLKGECKDKHTYPHPKEVVLS